jgi:Xaa-Pro aminopeptidase
MSTSQSEFQTKIKLLRMLLEKYGTDAVLLRRVSSFTWVTCGAVSYVNTASTEGAATLLITRDRLYLVTNNIEAPRMEQEEKLAEQGWEFRVSPWHMPLLALENLISDLSLISDVPFSGSINVNQEIAWLRSHLTPEEGERFRYLGHLCAETMTAVAQVMHPGMSEICLAGLLAFEALQRGIQPIVNLIATDDRAYRFRHPLPTEKKLDKYAMLVLCGRRLGLVCSITRLVHFGTLSEDLHHRVSATAQVNATLIAGSRPGRTLSDVLAEAQQSYANVGFPTEWQQHHQGGIAGYEPREILATPTSTEVISTGQALAWNPTIAGTKMEDTILVGVKTNELLTPTPLWPVMSINIPGTPDTILSHLVLER